MISAFPARLLLALFVAVHVLYPALDNNASASDYSGSVRFQKLMADLTDYVMQESAYPRMTRQPEIAMIAGPVLAAMFGKNHGDELPLAAYSPVDNRILIDRDLDLNEAFGQSYLVHELVHAFQFQSRTAAMDRCRVWLESEAYRIQARFLVAKGEIEKARPLLFLGLLQSACTHAYHPDLAAQCTCRRQGILENAN